MFKSVSAAIAIVAMLSSSAALAQNAPNLNGIWRQQDGSATVRVAPCPKSTNWCATVIEEKLKPNEPSLLNQMVVREMRSNGTKGWTGQYVVDGQTMKASAKLTSPESMNFKVCAIAFLCETIRLNRVKG
jgi:uncharacterized protein (DUF2147 family)